MEGTKTLTETQRSVTRKGDLVIVKTVETTTVTEPGKAPKITTKEKVDRYEGKDALETLPEDIKKQLEESKEIKGPINKTAARADFEKVLLEETNKKREAHGAAPLKLCDKASKYALERATEMAAKDAMVKRTSKEFGENVSCMWSNDPNHTVTAEEILARWYDEHTKYNFDKEPTDLTEGHFTQLVWKASKNFGAAAVKSDKNNIFVVAAYDPPGNWSGEFKENVSPIQKSGVGAFFKSLIKKKDSGSSSDSDSDSDESSFETFNKKGVKVHNTLRKKHGVPTLNYSATLAKHAQEWADHLTKTRKFEHRPGNSSYGENLYTYNSTSGARPSAKSAVTAWYNEIKDYTFGQEACQNHKTGKLNQLRRSIGHFTQVVWKDSREVGMGIARGSNGWIVVANYSPAGNFVGRYVSNVPSPKKH